ncbi:repressor LexA [bacterium]|jgi:repressor LexA|nr:repressor LexA [bacterium]
MKLSARQEEIYQYICSYENERGMTPQTVEIQKRFGYSANSTVIQHLQALEKKGYIRRSHKQKRSIHLLKNTPSSARSIPLRGVVPAGLLVEVFEQFDEVVLPEGILRNREPVFALEVRGDSMVEEHILNGDLILIEESSYAQNGQVAVVCYEGAMTLKKYYQEKDHIRLQPANATMEPIRIHGEVDVIGVMVGLLRGYPQP